METYYNYRFHYGENDSVKLFQCDEQIDLGCLARTKWQLITLNRGGQWILINMDKVNFIEEWTTECHTVDEIFNQESKE